MSWLFGSSSAGDDDAAAAAAAAASSSYASTAAADDPYAHVGLTDTAKVTHAEQGVADTVGGVVLSPGVGALAGAGAGTAAGVAGGFNPYGNLGEIDIDAIKPMFGKSGGPQYLEGFNKDGRDMFQRMVYNMGHSYLAGIALGGAYGAVEGLRNAPSNKFKIRLNSFLNAAGRRGSRAGNAFAVLAMFFSLSESLLENFEVEKYTGRNTSDVVYPLTAGALTGFLYKASSGRPRMMALYSIIGGGAIASVAGASRMMGESNIFL